MSEIEKRNEAIKRGEVEDIVYVNGKPVKVAEWIDPDDPRMKQFEGLSIEMWTIEENVNLRKRLKIAVRTLKKLKKGMFGDDFVENIIMKYEKWEKLVDDTLLKIGG